ncbi:MAG: polysaccharide deacetylase family protein [Clostridiales Family XIII bacterium]|jgi:peptidoglycan/xylan/chitin deacetylase (PgdA/CDA1 family)|nr:polysaccharide deacetylase family protein [Clostridiales Family XIII bacterium]
MRRGAKSVLKIAVLAVLLCVLFSLLFLSQQLGDLNHSLRTRIDVLNGLLTQQQAEISGLNEQIARITEATGVAPADATPEAEAENDVSGVWTPAPPRLWTEYRPYQELYPALYAKRSERLFARDKTVYLTFDDGPTIHTARVLDTLKEAGVKATFFIVGSSVARLGEDGKALLRRMADEGHTIGVHCNVHDYERIYASVEAFLDDFNAVFNLIRETTGLQTDLFRFPGGSVNSYNEEIRSELIHEMERRGFTYYDWNASSNDTAAGLTEESAWRNAVSRAGGTKRIILLMHDTKERTVLALPRIIATYKDKGYSFARLTNVDKPIVL